MSTLRILLSEQQLEQLADRISHNLMASKPTENASYSISEVADKLGVSARTIQRRVEAGIYKRISNISQIRISHSELTRILS